MWQYSTEPRPDPSGLLRSWGLHKFLCRDLKFLNHDGPRASGSASVPVGRLVPVWVARVVAGLPRWQATFIALWTVLMGAYPARVARACLSSLRTGGSACRPQHDFQWLVPWTLVSLSVPRHGARRCGAAAVLTDSYYEPDAQVPLISRSRARGSYAGLGP